MRLLFKVEDVFDISGRGCVIVPAIPEGLDFRIRANDQIELRTPKGGILQTYIASIELAKPQVGPCRMAITLPRAIAKQDVPTGTEVWFDQMHSFISRTVDAFRQSPEASDDEIYQKMVAEGLESKLAARLVEFLPMAYCRLILADTGARCSEMFQRRRHSGGLSHEQALAAEPFWTEIMSFAKAEQGRGAPGKDLFAIGARSAEFDAVNRLLNRGVRPNDITLSATVLRWPEEDRQLNCRDRRSACSTILPRPPYKYCSRGHSPARFHPPRPPRSDAPASRRAAPACHAPSAAPSAAPLRQR